MAANSMDHLFISPHLDDAVLSCGGTIHQLTARGDNVTVMTIMAGDPPEPIPETPIIKELHQRWRTRYNPVKQRRQEDRLALEHLGAEHEHCVLQDCVYRFGWAAGEKVALYPSEESLWHHVHPEDPTLAFLQTVEVPRDINLYFPLGVGGHVDHLIVRDWGLLLANDRQLALNWYAEYPYSQQNLR